jgi:two-component system KDP operon response regulator KdpE
MSEPTVTVVLIDDDKYIRRFVRAALEAEGMTVCETNTGRQGLAQAATRRPDLVIADLSLPDMEGTEVIRELRAWSTVPVIVLSARSREEDKVKALDAGADDYLTKPFGLPELSARIRAQGRRQIGGATGLTQVRFGTVLLDLGARRVLRGDEVVHLSPIEYRLLSVLARHAGKVLTHHQLFQEVWGPSRADNYHHYLRIYMAHLRQKLECDPAQPEHIVTESGVGYRLVGVSDYHSQ